MGYLQGFLHAVNRKENAFGNMRWRDKTRVGSVKQHVDEQGEAEQEAQDAKKVLRFFPHSFSVRPGSELPQIRREMNASSVSVDSFRHGPLLLSCFSEASKLQLLCRELSHLHRSPAGEGSGQPAEPDVRKGRDRPVSRNSDRTTDCLSAPSRIT